MQTNFAENLSRAQQVKQSDVALLLTPRLTMMPMPMARYDDPFLPFGKTIIDATKDLVCAYVFDLAAYLAIGAAGAVALERTVAYVGEGTIKILHGPFASADYAAAASDNAFNVDAVTVTDIQYMPAYLQQANMGAFVLVRGQSAKYDVMGNVYWPDEGAFTVVVADQPPRRIRLAGEDVLYAGRGEDFTERVRGALKAIRDAR
ncbi:MAG: hypothetical protein HXY40_19825 [Chloroflexi bacterium]|nr:hypothetical protein [Chloroflexota bacterium]